MTKSEDIFRSELSILEERCFPYQEIYLEAGDDKTASGLRKFIQGIKNLLMKTMDMISEKVHKAFQTEKSKQSLAALRSACLDKKYKGAKTIKCYDVMEYQKVLKETVTHLDKVISKYLKGYQASGKGLHTTDKMVDEVNKTIKESDEKLKKIKSEKVDMDIQDLLNWIDRQARKGNKDLFDFAYDYMRQLDEYAKIAAEFDKKADEYAEKNKMVRRPKGVTQTLTNVSSYVKRNIDWIGSFAIASACMMVHRIGDEASVEKNFDHLQNDDDWGERGNSSVLKGPQANKKRAHLMTKENRGERHRHDIAKMGEIGGSVAGYGFGMRNFLKAKGERRNSV